MLFKVILDRLFYDGPGEEVIRIIQRYDPCRVISTLIYKSHDSKLFANTTIKLFR